MDDYLTVDGKIPPLSIYVVRFPYYVETLYTRDLPQIQKIREGLCVLTPFADVEIIKAARKTVEGLLARWKRRGLNDHEAFYALGLAALAAGAEVDEETADLLLYVTPFAVQRVTHPVAVLTVLAALRPLGEKVPHRYAVALVAASEPTLLDQETVRYIYDALQRLRDRLMEARHIWFLVDAVRAFSNLLGKHPVHFKDRWEEAVADMCRLYGEVRKRGAATAPDSGLSTHRLFDAVAGAHVLAVALGNDVLAPLVQRYCGLGDLEKEAEAVTSMLDEAADHPEELIKIMKNDEDFAKWVTARDVTGDAGGVVEDLRNWFTVELARYKLNHAIDKKGELDAGKLKEAAEEFEKAAEIRRKLEQLEGYLTARALALKAHVLAARSWEELLARAKGFQELWEEAKKHLKPTTIYLAAATFILGYYLVYLAASGDRGRAEELLKKQRQFLDYSPEVSMATRLMLKLFGVGEGAKLDEVVDVFKPGFSPEYLPALLMLAGRLQRNEARKECDKLFNTQPSEAELCDIIVVAAAGSREATKRLKPSIGKVLPNIGKVVRKAHRLLDRVDGRTLVEVLAPISSQARLALMLLAAVERRADAVRLHGLWGSAAYKGTVLQPLFRAVYENCGDLDSEGCRMALLKLYYYHV